MHLGHYRTRKKPVIFIQDGNVIRAIGQLRSDEAVDQFLQALGIEHERIPFLAKRVHGSV